MKLHYALPAVAAMAAHAILLLGFTGKHPVATAVTKTEVTNTSVIYMPPEKPEPIELSTDESAKAKGTTDMSPPSGDEPPVIPVNRDRLTMVSVPPINGRIVTNMVIPKGRLGSPDGIEGGRVLNDPGDFDFTKLDRKPVTKLQVAPVYPALAKANGLIGEVVVIFTVDEKGRVISPRVLKSTDRIFEETTLTAISKWRFEPGKVNGRIVRFKMAVPVTFRLNGI